MSKSMALLLMSCLVCSNTLGRSLDQGKMSPLFSGLQVFSSPLAAPDSVDAGYQSERLNLIPMPQQVDILPDAGYTWSGKPVMIAIPESLSTLSLEAGDIVRDLRGIGVESDLVSARHTKAVKHSFVRFVRSDSLPHAGYDLWTSESQGALIVYGDVEGARSALRTLRQLISPGGIPAVHIHDYPRFQHRGLMLDVSRHFMPKSFVCKLIDEMARYKLNRFHWHLTDGGGWRLEIKSYPKLTGVTAFRPERDFMKWWEQGDREFALPGASGAYGGYYTQEDVREVVAYAQARGVEVIPEIEMPSHSHEVLYAYPQLSCTGAPDRWERDLCLGNPDTYTFIYSVLDEVIALFPSLQIHIGGDEADKEGWKSCPKCQRLMKEEGLKDVDQLQSYFMGKVSDYVRSRGRSVIVWDDVQAGGLPEGATVMSWRGLEGGLQAARSGHDAVMCPVGILYLDYYQSDRRYEPLANGWTTTFMRTYGYEPVPEGLTPREQKHIVGVQGNLWTEFVPTPEHAEYMIFPRLLALSEIAWSDPEVKDPADFKRRVNLEVKNLRARGVNSYTPSSLLQDRMMADYKQKRIGVMLDSERKPAEIRYTRDGTLPTSASARYTIGDTMFVADSAQIMAAHFEQGAIDGRVTTISVDYHRGIGKPLKWLTPISTQYDWVGGETALVDGVRGTPNFMDGIWLGTKRSVDNVVVVDLEASSPLRRISTRCMQQSGPGVLMPEWVEVSLSEDGEEYEKVGRVYSGISPEDPMQYIRDFSFYPGMDARYVKVHYHMPKEGAFLITDEIVIW